MGLLNVINSILEKKKVSNQEGINKGLGTISPTSVMDTSIASKVNNSSEGYLPKNNGIPTNSPTTGTNNNDNLVAVRDYINNWGKDYGVNNDNITWKGNQENPLNGDVYLNGQYLVSPTENDNGTTYVNESVLKEALNNYYSNNNLQEYKPAEYNSAYATQINNYLDSLLNGGKFEYDVNTDQQFQNYKKMYNRLGEEAYKNQIGSNAANTQGQTNSWAGTVAAQAQNSYNSKLMDLVPELEQNAYNRYEQDKQDIINKIGILETLENNDYSKYRDAINDYYTKLGYDRNVYENDRDYDTTVEQNNKNYDRSVFESDRNYDRDILESDRNYQETIRQFNKELDLALKKIELEGGGIPLDNENEDNENKDNENKDNDISYLEEETLNQIKDAWETGETTNEIAQKLYKTGLDHAELRKVLTKMGASQSEIDAVLPPT